MKKLADTVPFATLRSALDRAADEAAANLRPASTSLRARVDRLRRALDPIIDGYRHSAIGISGVFATDQSQSIASLLGQSVVEREGLTTTIARVTRHDVVAREAGAPSGAGWKRPLRPGTLNIWPSARADSHLRHEVDPLELLHWLRAESELTIVTFDSLGDVITRLALAKRLDGLLIVNSGRQFDLDLMGSAVTMLERKGIRILGQVKNVREGVIADRDAGRDDTG